MGIWLIHWTDATGEVHERTVYDGRVDIWEACRIVALSYRCPVYFTPVDEHGQTLRCDSAGHTLWTRVDRTSHAIDQVLA